jgi:hypothetical protein
MSVERSAGRKSRARVCTVAQLASAAAPPVTASLRRVNRLKDEVYREMLRLESNCPGAEMGLALALLRAALQRDSFGEDVQFQQWLTGVCALGLKMIVDSLNSSSASAE